MASTKTKTLGSKTLGPIWTTNLFELLEQPQVPAVVLMLELELWIYVQRV